MSRVTVEKIGDSCYLTIDEEPCRFIRVASDKLTSPITSNSDFNGIFSHSCSTVQFWNGRVSHNINFGAVWDCKTYFENPLAEIRRRVQLVYDTFAKAEAEKEVWSGFINEEPKEEELQTFTIIYYNQNGYVCKAVVKSEKSIECYDGWHTLPDFERAAFIFKGEIQEA